MNINNFSAKVRRQAAELERYVNAVFPGMAGNKTLRFIDGNFRAQGWQGATFKGWKANARGSTILIRRGQLRRSFRLDARPGYVRTWTNDPKAAVHNRGFKGTVTIREHKRRKYQKSRVGTGRFTRTGKERKKTVHVQTGMTTVKQHEREVNFPQRQFMPEKWNDSPVLVNSIRRQVTNDLKNIFK